MANRRRICLAVTAAAAVLLPPLQSMGAERPDLKVRRSVVTRGIRVQLEATPLCRLAADDDDSRRRALNYLADFGDALARAVGDLDVPLGFSVWRAEVKIVDHSPPSSDEPAGIRIVESSPSLDLKLMRAALRASTGELPNFRARCTFELTVRNGALE